MATTVRRVHREGHYESRLIQHLGIVGGICHECGLADLIDSHVEQKRRKVSVGQAVQAMILNALGFSGRALYLTPRFYKNRPVDMLVGEGLEAEDLHDSSLGTALDAMWERGVTELFFLVASRILERYGISSRFAHLDSTTFSLHGEYNSAEQEDEIPEGVIRITKGYSKDNEPYLNQVVLQLICAHKSSMPLWIEALSGNTADKRSFAKTVKEFQRQFEGRTMPYMVMDAAFYSKENLGACEGFRWVTRVPETLKEVKQHYCHVSHCVDKESRAIRDSTFVERIEGGIGGLSPDVAVGVEGESLDTSAEDPFDGQVVGSTIEQGSSAGGFQVVDGIGSCEGEQALCFLSGGDDAVGPQRMHEGGDEGPQI
jgi:transposase